MFSIIIPTFNRKLFLIELIEHLEKFSFKDFEILIIDDGSTDGSAEEIHSKYPHISYTYIENSGGPSLPRNIGAKMAKHDWLIFLDSDDLITEQMLLKYEKDIKTNCFDVIYSYAETFGGNESKQIIIDKRAKREGDIFNSIVFGNYIPLLTACLKKSTVEQVGGFSEKFTGRVEDYHFWLKVAALKSKFRFIEESLAHYRQHDDQISKNTYKEIYDILFIYFDITKRFPSKMPIIFFAYLKSFLRLIKLRIRNV